MSRDKFIEMIKTFPVKLTSGHKYVHMEKPDISIDSVSKVLDFFESDFDKYEISYYMAKSRSTLGTQEDISRIQNAIIYEWDTYAKERRDFGDMVHRNIDNQFRMGYAVDSDWQKFCTKLYADMQYGGQSSVVFPEQVVYHKQYQIGGTSDRMVIRSTRTKYCIADFYDTKTNIDTEKRKGIRYTSKKFMKAPFDFLEECEYTRDCLQLSMYAYLAEDSFNVKPGRLAIEHVKGPYVDAEYIPVPYMRYEAELILKAYRSRNMIMNNDDDNW